VHLLRGVTRTTQFAIQAGAPRPDAQTTHKEHTMKTYDVRVWEKAEHWHFDISVKATDIVAARKALLKDYPKRDYAIIDVREHH